VLGLEILLEDGRYADASRRHRNREALASTIESVTATRPTEHWLAVLEDAGVPCAPIQDYGQVFTDPHLLARNYFWDAPHRKVGPVRQLGSPMRFSRTPVRRDTAAPVLGQDSAELLAELGFGPAEA
jgi:crotonobetainyl-CoA:carnitine CoA-transferase CaiB-like acyl-CoA transferase